MSRETFFQKYLAAWVLFSVMMATSSCGTVVEVNKPVITGTVYLSWSAPTTRTDGSDLLDLSGYIVYYGIESGRFSGMKVIQDSNQTDCTIVLESGIQYYFVVTAFDSNGLESGYSNEISLTAVEDPGQAG